MSGVLYYRVRRVKAGPLVPCKIWFGPPLDPVTGEEMDRAPRWQVEVSGKLIDDPFSVVHLIGNQEPIIKGEQISKEEFEFLLSDAQWCREYEPDAPEANPTKPIDLNKMAPIKFK